jgi:hypothetical protein
MHNAFVRLGVKSSYMSMLEIVNSPRANREFLEYALDGVPAQSENHKRFYDACVDVAPHVKNAAALIFTVGVAWIPILDDKFILNYTGEEARRMTWRLTSAAENAEHLRAIVGVVQRAQPDIRIILTVSPIPIKNAFNGASAVVADCASKSNLRAAVQEILDDSSLRNVSYWPSFEAIRWLSGHMGQFFGTEGEDQRHPGKSYIHEITDAFVRAYFRD